uniref:Uncharacterized protein n=1 Tax=Timema douglasi TaxID=61478 RepID=A0A7R8VRL9_TIMDO|nr:unnamed protein product [Timema douglasi]
MQQTVEEERSRRQDQRRKQQEIAESSAQAHKKEQKNKKKKTTKSSPNPQNKTENGLKLSSTTGSGDSDLKKTTTQRDKSVPLQTGRRSNSAAGWLCGKLLKLFFSLVVLAALSLGALSYLDQPKFLYVLEVSNTTLTTSLEQLRVTYIELAAHPTTQKLVDNMHTLWKSLCYNAYHIYSTVSQQVPIYLETVKKKETVLTAGDLWRVLRKECKLQVPGAARLVCSKLPNQEGKLGQLERENVGLREENGTNEEDESDVRLLPYGTRLDKLLLVETDSEADSLKIMENKCISHELLYERPRKKIPIVIMFDIPSDTTVEELKDTTFEQNLSDEKRAAVFKNKKLGPLVPMATQTDQWVTSERVHRVTTNTIEAKQRSAKKLQKWRSWKKKRYQRPLLFRTLEGKRWCRTEEVADNVEYIPIRIYTSFEEVLQFFRLEEQHTLHLATPNETGTEVGSNIGAGQLNGIRSVTVLHELQRCTDEMRLDVVFLQEPYTFKGKVLHVPMAVRVITTGEAQMSLVNVFNGHTTVTKINQFSDEKVACLELRSQPEVVNQANNTLTQARRIGTTSNIDVTLCNLKAVGNPERLRGEARRAKKRYKRCLNPTARNFILNIYRSKKEEFETSLVKVKRERERERAGREVKLKIAPVKTAYMLFKGTLKRDPILNVNGHTFRCRRTNRHLCVPLDERHNFGAHIGQHRAEGIHLPLQFIKQSHQALHVYLLGCGVSVLTHQLKKRSYVKMLRMTQRSILLRQKRTGQYLQKRLESH